MPERQEVEFVIRPDGTVEEHVRGASGPDCEAMTQSIEKALGEVTTREHTSDYYKTANNNNKDESLTEVKT